METDKLEELREKITERKERFLSYSKQPQQTSQSVFYLRGEIQGFLIVEEMINKMLEEEEKKRNLTVTYQTSETYNVETEEEVIKRCKEDNGENIEIISVED